MPLPEEPLEVTTTTGDVTKASMTTPFGYLEPDTILVEDAAGDTKSLLAALLLPLPFDFAECLV